ncbi:MAG: TerB family tellurite resistance protein [Pseudomonadota bacterium]
MALVDLLNVRQLFGGDSKEPDPETFRELLVMVLSRATDVDAYTDPVEVEVVQKVLMDYIGEEVSGADIRIAAKSTLYEAAPLEKYVSRIGPKLDKTQRLKVMSALVEVLKADDKVASSETDFFNTICEALGLTYADIAGVGSD